jgi:S-adenosylmethionine:tRNA ribosyltransferase-isomerase
VKRAELIFDRPETLAATAPAEAQGKARDAAKLLVSTCSGHQHSTFRHLADYLVAGDVLVVNESATLGASLPAQGSIGSFLLNFATDYGKGLWVAEPRWSTSQPGPLPLHAGDVVEVAGVPVRLISPYPGLPRLWFVQAQGDIRAAMAQAGSPIRYGYVKQAYPLEVYQTVFARVPGSAEMPSAAYPFTQRVVNDLEAKGVEIARLVLHTGVSSLEVETDEVEAHPLYPEPFSVPAQTAQAVNRAQAEGRRVIAVGTTVVRALETAWNRVRVEPMQGFTRAYIHPQRGVHVIDGLITGLHDPVTSHLAMLYAIANRDLIHDAYREAVTAGYLWHEFGDSHLILTREAVEVAGEITRLACAG